MWRGARYERAELPLIAYECGLAHRMDMRRASGLLEWM